MNDITFGVKNFERFQHYKDRSPPWIKLYNTVLRDYDFARLHDTVKWHLVGIWSLASQHNNRIPYDSAWVTQQIGATERVDIDALAEAGWLVMHHASKPLARRKQTATPEKRTETETETDKKEGKKLSTARLRASRALLDPATKARKRELWRAKVTRFASAHCSGAEMEEFIREVSNNTQRGRQLLNHWDAVMRSQETP